MDLIVVWMILELPLGAGDGAAAIVGEEEEEAATIFPGPAGDEDAVAAASATGQMVV